MIRAFRYAACMAIAMFLGAQMLLATNIFAYSTPTTNDNHTGLVATLPPGITATAPGRVTLTPIPTCIVNSSIRPNASQLKAPTPPDWVSDGNAYVHLVHDYATVDASISKHFNARIVAEVVQAVKKYDSLPLRERSAQPFVYNGHATMKANANGCGAPAPCTEQATITTRWWGQQIWLNDCLVNDLLFAMGTGAAISTIIAAACTPCAPVAGVIAGVLALYTGWMAWANNRCGNRGINVNIPWTGPAWVSTVC